jgi:hypothetical protein
MPVEKVEGGYRWGKTGKVYKRRIDAVKQGQAAHAAGYNQFNKGGVPKGYHKMPDGSIMKNSEHKDYRHGGLILHTKDNRKKK